jgi:hypothetical protein
VSGPLKMYDPEELSRFVSSVQLPEVPISLSYWDDFAECTRVIRDFSTCSQIEIHDDGTIRRWGLDLNSSFQRQCIRGIIADLMSAGDVTSVTSWISNFKRVCSRLGQGLVEQFSVTPPFEIRHRWEAFVFPLLTSRRETDALKRLLHFFCRYRVGSWRPEFASLVSALSAPHVDPFRTVRSGECFIPAEHLHILYHHLDELAARAAQGRAPAEECRIGVALILAEQHGFRPSTIARVKDQDVRVYRNGAVHVSATMVKQHDGSERIRITRRIKREWCPIVSAFQALKSDVLRVDSTASQRFLGWTPHEVGKAIADRMENLCGERWTATDLRHTAAQRMVDSGASADQLAEFLCQNNTLVGNVYFEQSPTQAKRINDALAVSPIYAKIPEIHRTRTIDKASLLAVPEDNQIGGAPHGIAIAGIGACQSGQSLCDKNPVLSCYGCRRFLAVADAEIHEHVVSSLRHVVLEFEKAGRAHNRSPAYTQLQRTLTKAAAIANDVREREGKSE